MEELSSVSVKATTRHSLQGVKTFEDVFDLAFVFQRGV